MGHLLLLRHGRSLANDRGLIVSHAVHARAAYGLTPRGRDQVRRTVARAVSAGTLVQPLRLLSSPLLRARESAEVAGEVLGVGPNVDERLTERDFGELELGPDRLYDQVWEADAGDPTHRCWGVESVADVLRRVGALVDELSRDGRGATVVLCTHGDVASTLLCASQSAPLGRHRVVGALPTGGLREIGSVDAILGALASLDAGSRRGQESRAAGRHLAAPPGGEGGRVDRTSGGAT